MDASTIKARLTEILSEAFLKDTPTDVLADKIIALWQSNDVAIDAEVEKLVKAGKRLGAEAAKQNIASN